MIQTAENTMETFNEMLADKYPEQFAGLKVHDTHAFYNLVLRSHMTWDETVMDNVSYHGHDDRIKRTVIHKRQLLVNKISE